MAFRDTSSFGKRMEYEIMGKMLVEGHDVYLPMVDDHGVDCVVKNKSGNFIEIQIKARSKSAKQPGCFTVDNHPVEIANFYFVFYSELIDTTWVFSSKEFIENSSLNLGGRNKGRRKITLVSPKGNITKKFKDYIVKDFSFINV